MVRIDEFSRMVSAIHAAAITPEHWIDAMTVVRESLNATSSGMIIADDTSRMIKCASLPSDAMQAYSDYYRTVDYVLDAVERGPVGVTRGGEALVALNAHSEFNADWMTPHRMNDGLFVRLTDGPTPTCFLVASPRHTESFATPERVPGCATPSSWSGRVPRWCTSTRRPPPCSRSATARSCATAGWWRDPHRPTPNSSAAWHGRSA